jgi:hypothetical protein
MLIAGLISKLLLHSFIMFESLKYLRVLEVTYLAICVCIPQYGNQKLASEAVNIPSSKVIPVHACTGPEGSRSFTPPDFQTVGT